jgi:hypothetical protein
MSGKLDELMGSCRSLSELQSRLTERPWLYSSSICKPGFKLERPVWGPPPPQEHPLASFLKLGTFDRHILSYDTNSPDWGKHEILWFLYLEGRETFQITRVLALVAAQAGLN